MKDRSNEKKRLSAYECWRKKIDEKLTDAQYKRLLIENGIIVKTYSMKDDGIEY